LQTTTIILPVSREQHLLRVFASLEVLECDRERTGLLVCVDGDEALHKVAANLVDQSKFADRQCVRGDIPGPRREFSINTRRRRIALIHNEIHKLIKPSEYVFLLEDDGVLPPDALSRLLADYQAHPYAGFIEGVELGRWNIPHVGAWRADDVYEPMVIESTIRSTTQILDGGMRTVGSVPDMVVEEIDAGGLYCTLTKYDRYIKHEFKPFENCSLGPDFDWGIELPRLGFKNFVDWSVAVEHCRPDGTSIHPRSSNPVQMRFVREGISWSGSVIEG
jgi:hypothetical protein